MSFSLICKAIQSKWCAWRLYGFENLFATMLFRVTRIDLRFYSVVERRRRVVGLELFGAYDGTIQSGYYKGLILSSSAVWSGGDVGNQVLGCYEIEVQERIASLVSQFGLKSFVVIGAGDGFHAVGGTRYFGFDHCFAFELVEESRRRIEQLAIQNGVDNKVKIFGECTPAEILSLVDRLRERSLFLIDVEGFEIHLLSVEVLRKLKGSGAILIIELHEFDPIMAREIAKLVQNISNEFEVSEFTYSGRKLSVDHVFDNYSDVERALVICENRPRCQRWLACV